MLRSIQTFYRISNILDVYSFLGFLCNEFIEILGFGAISGPQILYLERLDAFGLLETLWVPRLQSVRDIFELSEDHRPK